MSQGLTPQSIIYDTVTAGDPQISHDGTLLQFTRTWSDPSAAKSKSAIWIANADGSEQRVFSMRSSLPRWSPDGTRVAFVCRASVVAENR